MYKDTNGNEWTTAAEALAEFVGDLPNLSEEESETVFQFTRHDADAASNLAAIAYGVTYAGLDDRFGGDNYPVPFLAHTHVYDAARSAWQWPPPTWRRSRPQSWPRRARCTRSGWPGRCCSPSACPTTGSASRRIAPSSPPRDSARRRARAGSSGSSGARRRGAPCGARAVAPAARP